VEQRRRGKSGEISKRKDHEKTDWRLLSNPKKTEIIVGEG
jgi:hypothetical protein